MPEITLGSLFSGIGGFEYAASLYGIKPVWASEIEDAPIRITKRHFPDMVHLGDITKINGAEIEPVDIITGGSPCFPAGTLVLTETGYKPIEKIRVGDMVLTHKNRWRLVTAVGNKQEETIILRGNCTLETTRNHPIYSVVIGDTEFEHECGQWVRAEDMLGRYWATPRLIQKDHRVFADTYEAQEITKSVALAFRYYLEYHNFDSELICIDGTYKACVSITPSIHFNGLNHLSWYKVTSVEPTNRVKTVYNISVEDDESYIADGIVVHNCQSLSTAGQKHGISVKCANCGNIIQMLNVDDNMDCCPECGSELEFTRSGLFMEQMRVIKEMRDSTNGEYPKIAVWENVCFVGDTFVTCEDGYKEIKDVKIGDRVKTLSGVYNIVKMVHKTKFQKVIRICVSGAEDITVTSNHQFYCRVKYYDKSGNRCFSDPSWICAKELTDKHMIAYRIDKPSLPEDFISETEAWAIGRWLADGSVDLKRSNPRIFISSGLDKAESTKGMLEKLPYRVYQSKPHETAVNFNFTSDSFYRLIQSAGIGAANKRVPPFVFKLPIHLQQSVLDGYISGDGCVQLKGESVHVSAGTVSRDLAYGIARLIRNCYHTCVSISRKCGKDGKIGDRIIKSNYDVYRIFTTLNGKVTKSYFDGEFVWQPVRSIQKLHDTQTVYNLSVLGENTYEANGVVCHNCGALSSNNGDDFYVVLNEFCKLIGERVPKIRPEKWIDSGEILGDHGSIAWRLMDAQYWGVPQRRKRIFLVADFRGQSASEILFKSESLRRHSAQSETPWQRTSGETGNSTECGDTSRKHLYNNVSHRIK